MELVHEIKRVFSERTYPGDEHLLLPGDDEGEGHLFIGADWQIIERGQLEMRTFVLNCFTPDAFCYFLPAYLIASIENPTSGLADVILEKISPPKNDLKRPS